MQTISVKGPDFQAVLNDNDIINAIRKMYHDSELPALKTSVLAKLGKLGEVVYLATILAS